MNQLVSHGLKREFVKVSWEDESEEQSCKTLSRAEAQQLRRTLTWFSPWRVIAVQALVGMLCAGVAAAVTMGSVTGSAAGFWSALYGAASVVVPNILLARGMTKPTSSPMASASGFMFWEMLKIGAAIAMLVIAAKVVPNLSWPALLAAMVVCMKVNWFALLWRGR